MTYGQGFEMRKAWYLARSLHVIIRATDRSYRRCSCGNVCSLIVFATLISVEVVSDHCNDVFFLSGYIGIWTGRGSDLLGGDRPKWARSNNKGQPFWSTFTNFFFSTIWTRVIKFLVRYNVARTNSKDWLCNGFWRRRIAHYSYLDVVFRFMVI